MSEIQVGQINSTDGSTAITTGADGYVSFAKTQIGGRKNMVLNGDMRIAQRGTSVSGITGAGYFTCDRWAWYSNCEDTITQSQSTDAPDGFSSSLKIEVTTAETSVATNENARIQYGIEGKDLQQLAYGTSSAKSLTVSFWVKSSVAGNYTCTVQHIDAVKYYSNVYTINSADTWEYKTVTVSGYTSTAINDDTTEGMRINFGLTTGTDYTSGATQTWGDSTSLHSGLDVDIVSTNGATWQITGVQLEVGPLATPFEHRSYGEELALCQRYYEQVGGNVPYDQIGLGHQRTTTETYFSLSFKQTKRATPTVSYVGDIIVTDRKVYDRTVLSLGDTYPSVTGFHGEFNHDSVGADYRSHFVTSKNVSPFGYMKFDAEL